MPASAIEVQNLGKRYLLRHQSAGPGLLRDRLAGFFRRRTASADPTREDFWALRDIDFTVKPGEVVGIVGRNGAGKSTLLKILSRITEPTTGRIVINGRVASLLEVGTGFHGELSGRENIFLNGAILGMSRAEIRRKFDEIVAFSEVEKFLDTPVKHYSSGMYVRLAFAVAAHLEPEILIVDEVLAVGDAAFQKKCLGKMHEVATGHGRTVLFVSHNSGALLDICDSAIWLNQGKLVRQGPIADVLSAYLQTGSRLERTFDTKAGRPHISAVQIDQAALAQGRLTVRVKFASPFALNPPVVGLILSDKLGRPIGGSNGRMTGDAANTPPTSEGEIVGTIESLPLHSATYRVSVFLGDATADYDESRDALEFDFVSPRFYPQAPSIEFTGPVDLPWRWTLSPPVAASASERGPS